LGIYSQPINGVAFFLAVEILKAELPLTIIVRLSKQNTKRVKGATCVHCALDKERAVKLCSQLVGWFIAAT
jgi:hypothetical protein